MFKLYACVFKEGGKPYSYKAPMMATYKVGDKVRVPMGDGERHVTIVAADVKPDDNQKIEYKEILGLMEEITKEVTDG